MPACFRKQQYPPMSAGPVNTPAYGAQNGILPVFYPGGKQGIACFAHWPETFLFPGKMFSIYYKLSLLIPCMMNPVKIKGAVRVGLQFFLKMPAIKKIYPCVKAHDQPAICMFLQVLHMKVGYAVFKVVGYKIPAIKTTKPVGSSKPYNAPAVFKNIRNKP